MAKLDSVPTVENKKMTISVTVPVEIDLSGGFDLVQEKIKGIAMEILNNKRGDIEDCASAVYQDYVSAYRLQIRKIISSQVEYQLKSERSKAFTFAVDEQRAISMQALPAQVQNALKSRELNTKLDVYKFVAQHGAEALKKFPNLGKASYKTIMEWLELDG